MKRREFVSLVAGSAFAAESGKGRVYSSEMRRYADPATELEVLRLTDPAHTCLLPSSGQRSISKRSGFLLYTSDRAGSLQAYRMDLKSGESRQLTEAEALDPGSLTLLPDERGFCYLDGLSLKLSLFTGSRDREVHRAESSAKLLNVSDSGVHAVFVDGVKLRLFSLVKGEATTLVEAGITLALTRPRRTQVLYFRDDGTAWSVDFDGKANRPLKLVPSAAIVPGMAQWAPNGRTFTYLRVPNETTELNTLREHTPDENADQMLAKTSQFVQFGVNGDASVFVGASRSKASPALLLLLRVTRREFTLCEHNSSNPVQVSPIFTPNSQSVLFQSDRHGKPAIYRIRVDKLVEETNS